VSIERRRTRSGALRFNARVKHHGRLVASRTFRLKADAETWEREQYRALRLGQFVSPRRGSTSVAEVIEGFLESRRGQVAAHSWRTDKDNLASVRRAWGNRAISSIGESEVLRFLTEESKVKARSTVQRCRTTVSALFTYATRERYVTNNPVRAVRVARGERRDSEGVGTFTEAQLAETLALQLDLNPRMAEVTEFLSLTGLRWSELRALRVGDVLHVPFPRLRIDKAHSDNYQEKGSKAGKARSVPLSARAMEIALSRCEGRAAGDYLFTGVTGTQLRGNLFRRFVDFGMTAPGRTVHDLRHYAASHWLRSGIPVHQVAKWLGHANANTTLRIYAHVLGEAQDLAAIARLDALVDAR
jgi:integrase